MGSKNIFNTIRGKILIPIINLTGMLLLYLMVLLVLGSSIGYLTFSGVWYNSRKK